MHPQMKSSRLGFICELYSSSSRFIFSRRASSATLGSAKAKDSMQISPELR